MYFLIRRLLNIMFKYFIGRFLCVLLNNFTLKFFASGYLSDLVENLRTQSYRLMGAKIGKNSFIRSGSFIAYPKNLIIGNNSIIGFSSRLYNYSNFVVGNDSELGPNLHVQTNDHRWSCIKLPLGKQGTFTKSVQIGNGVFIGANVTILQGVIIEDLCVVAAGATVVNNLKTGYLHAGLPARPIKLLQSKSHTEQ